MRARVAARTDRPMRCVNRLGASVRKGDFATLISDYFDVERCDRALCLKLAQHRTSLANALQAVEHSCSGQAHALP